MMAKGKNFPSEEHNITSVEASSAEDSAAATTTSLMDAQLDLLNAMNQCAVAWLTLPMALAEAVHAPVKAAVKSAEREKADEAGSVLRSGSAGFESASVQSTSVQGANVRSTNVTFPQSNGLSATAWVSAPVIDGIEETFNDQMFQPRPRETPERDVLTLWERRNEFGGSGSAALASRAGGGRHAA